MNKILSSIALILTAICVINRAYAQSNSPADWENIRDSDLGILTLNSDEALPTDLLLQMLRWDSLTVVCQVEADRVVDRCYISVTRDSLLTHYRYGRQGYRSSIEITDYRGIVLSYDIKMEKTLRPITSSYFDKPAWLRYAHEMLGPIPDSLSLSVDEPEEVLVAYYRLLGAGIRSEYGWICEYSTVGMAPAQRLAAIQLVVHKRSDLLRRVLSGPNIEGRVYAADALIYLNHLSQLDLEKFAEYRSERMRELNGSNLRPEIRDGWIRQLEQEQGYYEAGLLTPANSAAIEALRSSDQIVRTCGNAGSYKIYPRPVSEVLSDSAIAKIPEQYEALEKDGYFRK
jgi:hypothetical protein